MDKENKNKKRKNYLLILLLLFIIIILLLVTATYTFNSKIIDIVGFTGVYKEANWKIDFDNISMDREGSIYVEEIKASNTSIKDFDITFIKPGDGFTIKLDVVNNGTIDAKLDVYKVADINCLYEDNTSALDYCDKYVDYSIMYIDGSPIKKGDVLKEGEKRTVVFKMKYKEDAPILYERVINMNDMNISFVYGQE